MLPPLPPACCIFGFVYWVLGLFASGFSHVCSLRCLSPILHCYYHERLHSVSSLALERAVLMYAENTAYRQHTAIGSRRDGCNFDAVSSAAPDALSQRQAKPDGKMANSLIRRRRHSSSAQSIQQKYIAKTRKTKQKSVCSARASLVAIFLPWLQGSSHGFNLPSLPSSSSSSYTRALQISL